MIKSLSIAALTAAISLLSPSHAYAAQGSIVYTYTETDAGTKDFGSSKAEHYNMAIDLTDDAFVGRTVSTIKVAMRPSPVYNDTITDESGAETIITKPCLSGLCLWLSKTLNAETVDGIKTIVPDVASWQIETPIEGELPEEYVWVTYDLAEPYTITEGGVYAGMSFNVDKLTDATKKPVVLFTPGKAGGFYTQTSRTYKNWNDRSLSTGGVLPMYVTLTGDYPVNGAFPGKVPYGYFELGRTYDFVTSVTNVGQTEIKDINFTVEADGNSLDGSYTFPEPVPAVYGARKDATFTIPVVQHEGTIDVKIHITKVNGEPNEDAGTSVASVSYVTMNPKHLALVEEYTGTWCGYCVRGLAAMHQMNERYDDFIGIAYHDRDAMAMAVGDPEMVSGYPGAVVERTLSTDPYYADKDIAGFSLPQLWERYNAEFTPVAISVEAEWNPEDRTVTATSEVKWTAVPGDIDEANYRIEYVLVADSLSGVGEGWDQKNYYSGTDPTTMEYMEEYCEGPSKMRGLIFDDVAILTTGLRGVEGSIPSFEYGKPTYHTQVFHTDDAINYLGEPIPFYSHKLRVVAFVLKGYNYGTVLNACKCEVVDPTIGGIESLASDKNVISETYYDLQGRVIANPESGIYVKSTLYDDGSIINTKVSRR